MNPIFTFILGLVTGIGIMLGVSVYFTRWAFRHPQKIMHMMLSMGKKKAKKNGSQDVTLNGPLPPIFAMPRTGWQFESHNPDRD